MEYVSIRGPKVPALGLGPWKLAGDACERVVSLALGLGYRHIDTAALYANEREVGAALRGSGVPRGELFITSKLAPDALTAAAVQRGTYESLERLGLDYLDLMLIHWPSVEVPLTETLDAMQLMMEVEAIRSIGVSNFPPALLAEAIELAPIFCVQVEYHPFLAEPSLLEMAQAHGLLLTAYSPLAQGRVAADPTLRRIGRAHGKSASQVALRWLLDQPNVAAIPKAASEAHLRANLDVFDFALTEAEQAAIDGLDRGERLVDPDFAPDWQSAGPAPR
jgi:2,5-diketo-D-gluconate reductase B